MAFDFIQIINTVQLVCSRQIKTITEYHANHNQCLLSFSKMHADFGSVYRGIVAEGITLDHNCDIQSEAEAVGRLTSDPNPIRCSDSDRKSLGSRAPLR
jgi:hypothetical protein